MLRYYMLILQAETFQNDIYPPAPSGRPGLNASEWFEGKNANVPLFDLEQIYSPDGSVDVSVAKTLSPIAAPPPPDSAAAASAPAAAAPAPVSAAPPVETKAVAAAAPPAVAAAVEASAKPASPVVAQEPQTFEKPVLKHVGRSPSPVQETPVSITRAQPKVAEQPTPPPAPEPKKESLVSNCCPMLGLVRVDVPFLHVGLSPCTMSCFIKFFEMALPLPY